MNAHEIIAAYQRAGQGQVFAFWERLDSASRADLLAQAAEIELAEIESLHRTLGVGGGATALRLNELQPAPCTRLPGRGGNVTAWNRARAAGEAALRGGHVAAFTVAGGQGTRLGFDGPKGTFAITPVRGKSLFQVFAEKIAAAGRHYGRPLHWFILTSHANHEQTANYFSAHRFFNLDRNRVHFLRQGRMPAVDFSGKILLETIGGIALNPDGHGGSLRALHRSGALDLLKSEGVDTLSYFQVDNPLVRCIDPAFLGFHLLGDSEMSSKMVPKVYPEEKVGLFCLGAGQLGVVEYSDMPPAMQRETTLDGRLRFDAGNIAVHILAREFARRMATGGDGAALSFHRADKKISGVDAAGRPVEPERPNGIKFEMFVFDALSFARNPQLVETSRADEFSPVKNAEGVDSPRTAREDQLRQFARWFRAAGVGIETDATGLPSLPIEVSPLFGYDEPTFLEAWNKLSPPPVVSTGMYLE